LPSARHCFFKGGREEAMAKHIDTTGRVLGMKGRTETVDNNETITVHASAAHQHNQTDLEFARGVTGGGANPGVWGDPHVNEDGPSHMLGEPAGARAWDGDYGFDGVGLTFAGTPHQLVGDWNSDGVDTLGIADASGDGVVDAADYVV
jgi:hypothetical protein